LKEGLDNSTVDFGISLLNKRRWINL